MYYEEEIIDGILHFRYDPNGKFEVMSAYELTQKVLDLKAQNTLLRNKLAEVE